MLLAQKPAEADHQQVQNGIRQIFKQQSCKWTLNLTGKIYNLTSWSNKGGCCGNTRGQREMSRPVCLPRTVSLLNPAGSKLLVEGYHCCGPKGLFLFSNSRQILGIKSTVSYISVHISTRFYSLYFISPISFCLGWNAQHIKNNLHYINGYFGTAFYSSVCYYFSFQKNEIMSFI